MMPDRPRTWWLILDRLVVVAFIAGLLVPATFLVAGLRPPRLENRPLLEMPAVALGGLLDSSWARGVDAYLTDNGWLRRAAVPLRGELHWLTGGTGNLQVVRGRDDWLFIRDEFQPHCLVTAADLAAGFHDVASGFAAAGQEFRFVLAPDKHTVYPDKVRRDFVFEPSCSETGRAALQAGMAAQGTTAVDAGPFLDAVRRARPRANLFYPQDSHWTPEGALVAIRALIDSMAPGLWRDDEIVAAGTRRRRTDLARLIGLGHVEEATNFLVRPGITLQMEDVALPSAATAARTIFRVSASGSSPTIAGRTIVIYDSFFGIYVPLVAPFFADTTWVHVGDMLNHPELATNLGPFDRIVFERVERGLYGTDVRTLLEPLIR